MPPTWDVIPLASLRVTGLADVCYLSPVPRWTAPRLVWFGVIIFAWTLASRVTWAQDKPTLSGAWTASAVSESWAIGDWGEACGPKPRGQGGGGGAVQVKEMGGELSISGAGRGWSTGECWEQMPGLSRTSHS